MDPLRPLHFTQNTKDRHRADELKLARGARGAHFLLRVDVGPSGNQQVYDSRLAAFRCDGQRRRSVLDAQVYVSHMVAKRGNDLSPLDMGTMRVTVDVVGGGSTSC